jgi:stress response protein SCP2
LVAHKKDYKKFFRVLLVMEGRIEMSISLQKGQKVSLSKDNAGLSKVVVGLGWDEAPQTKKGFFAPKPQPIDCDASAILLRNGKLCANEDIIYFGNLKHPTGTVQHMGDNLTGAGDGDDEQIIVDLASVPQIYDKIVVVVNIYQAVQRKQHFGMIKNAFIRIVDARNNTELCKYNLSDDYSNMTAMIFGEIYRHNGEWKFNAMGQGTTDPGLGELANRFI